MLLYKNHEVIKDSSSYTTKAYQNKVSKSKVGKRSIKVLVHTSTEYYISDTMAMVVGNKIYVNPNIYAKIEIGLCK